MTNLVAGKIAWVMVLINWLVLFTWKYNESCQVTHTMGELT